MIEDILPAEPDTFYPLCLDGERRCPPEDVGGTVGYAEFLEALADPEHERHDDLVQWIGGEWDPTRFWLWQVNEELRLLPYGPKAPPVARESKE